jgi:nucleolar protein 56
VKFNPNRADTMIIQSIALLDQLDKDINTFAMRVREWYSWHFPELKEIVSDNFLFARCAAYIKDKSKLTEEHLPGLQEIVSEESIALRILKAARSSMGMDTSEQDMMNILIFTERMISLALYRKQLYSYLEDKMATVAPNLSALIGETVAARLIQKAGSLTSLAKCPASTVQILGAEKALFRALKTKGNTPKYGLIYHSSFIGRASTKNKGRISRYLANKCSIASRIDSFIDEPTKAYGEELRAQVEERLTFYDSGATPRKNIDVMTAVSNTLRPSGSDNNKSKKESKKSHKKEVAVAAVNNGSDSMMEVVDEPVVAVVSDVEEKKKKKEKKEKKRTLEEFQEPSTTTTTTIVATVDEEDSGEKKKKKKKKVLYDNIN